MTSDQGESVGGRLGWGCRGLFGEGARQAAGVVGIGGGKTGQCGLEMCIG